MHREIYLSVLCMPLLTATPPPHPSGIIMSHEPCTTVLYSVQNYQCGVGLWKALCIPHFPGVRCEYLNDQSFQNSRYMHFHITALLGIKLQSNPPFILKQILNNFLFELWIEKNYFSSLMHAVHDINHDNHLIFHDSPRLIPSQRFRMVPRL